MGMRRVFEELFVDGIRNGGRRLSRSGSGIGEVDGRPFSLLASNLGRKEAMRCGALSLSNNLRRACNLNLENSYPEARQTVDGAALFLLN